MVKEILIGVILADELTMTLAELSRLCSVDADWIIQLVDEGILEADGSNTIYWRFSCLSLFRARRVQRLQRDLGINLSGVALVLTLQDEIERLRRLVPPVF
ncbi:MAG: chaperone modulator CbpM [bacterium]|nr:MerR family transcriptional regulator [Gammaproteobacteria bacterium]HIL96142.1 MerR family transcriptional regulator [Pseudomonadales bacterium]